MQATLREIRTLGVPVLPSDTTKRLVALDRNSYSTMLRDALNPEDRVVRLSLPVSRQQKFNKELTFFALKYKGTSLGDVLFKCKVSEPLPSRPYALPKDHKQGELKDRPLISTVNSVV